MDFAPLPLTYDDLTDELNITRKHAQQEVKELHKAGQLSKTDGRGRGRTTLIWIEGTA